MDKAKQYKYTITIEKITSDRNEYFGNCNEILFLNKANNEDGTHNAVTVYVNGMYLTPGEWWSTEGNAFEMDTTKYNLKVTTNGAGVMWVIRKTYANNF